MTNQIEFGKITQIKLVEENTRLEIVCPKIFIWRRVSGCQKLDKYPFPGIEIDKGNPSKSGMKKE